MLSSSTSPKHLHQEQHHHFGIKTNLTLTTAITTSNIGLQHLDHSSLGLIFSFLPLNQLAFLSESGLDLVCKRFFRVLHGDEGVLLNFWRRVYMREYEKSSLCPSFSYRELAHYVTSDNSRDAVNFPNDPSVMTTVVHDENIKESMSPTTLDNSEYSLSWNLSQSHWTSDHHEDSSQVFRWLLVNLIRSRDRVQSGGVEMRENFSLVTPLLSLESRCVPTCFSVCNVLNRCVEFIGIGTFDYKLQLYVRDYGQEFLQGFHRKQTRFSKKTTNSLSVTNEPMNQPMDADNEDLLEEDESEEVISASSLVGSDSKYHLVDKTISAHYDEITCIRFLNSQYFSHTPRYYHDDNSVHNNPINAKSSASIAQSSLLMITGSKDKTIKVWKIEFPKAPQQSSSLDFSKNFHIECMATLSAHTDWIRDVIPMSKHPDKLVSISRDKSIKIWSLHTMQLKHSIQPNNLVWCMADHVDKGLLITASTSGELIFYDVHSGSVVHRMKPHSDLITKILYVPALPVTYSHDNEYRTWNSPKLPSIPLIITCSYDKSISVMNANNFERLVRIDEAHSTPIFSISMHGQRLTSSSVDGCVKNWILSISNSSSATGTIVDLQASMEQSLIGYRLPHELNRASNIFDMNKNRQVKVVSSVRSNTTEDIIISNSDSHNFLCVWTSKHHQDNSSQLIRYPLPDVVLNPKNHYSIQQLLKVLPSEIIVKDFTICGNRIICLLEFLPIDPSNSSTNTGGALANSVFMQKRGCICMWQL
ncbi:hypothetical protein C9374_008782 [Naegleria lovaniensis]|uniref:Guanine nucleotide-binding protein subunit beta-like protein n=1 Tax=Naegleria lovaniensis TaxID=51637 RepID=A0AA88KFX0_NAELO|nr:uncharacterized protein C9374_008782 [Naegleria lovaniensis]KAG2378160.1 hypothetical protein C9374_008782 [Naegleria lovaniensis]